MTYPRTPRYFPHMKVRGTRRRRLAPYQRLAGAFDNFGRSTDRAAVALRSIGDALSGGHRG